MNKIKQVITYNIRKSIISIIVLFILFIVAYCYDEYILLDLQEQLVPSVYSQSPCDSTTHLSLKNPLDRFPLSNHPIKIDNPSFTRDQLLNIKITGNPTTTQLCYNPYAKTYYTVDKTSLTVEITSEILNFKKVMKVNPLNLERNPMIGLIGGVDGILEPLQSSDCPPKPKDPNTSFNCSWNKTNLTITEKDQDLILGTSKENQNGIVIISQKPKGNANNPEPAEIIKACGENKPSKYSLPQDSVIELECK